ncbi:hypothetical protein [Methylobacterium sp. E-016]|uniref:hypothetical protein n=1 Tax=Methylobacterium sp. E-016 TaxID=2836556 RepID=UPI0028BED74F|nr:hypothetical protein [Methylobacterium sp. E-016]
MAPEAAAEHFGWLAACADADMPASSTLTRAWLGWHPEGRDLIAGLEATDYAYGTA